jgi:hypothetical protein
VRAYAGEINQCGFKNYNAPVLKPYAPFNRASAKTLIATIVNLYTEACHIRGCRCSVCAKLYRSFVRCQAQSLPNLNIFVTKWRARISSATGILEVNPYKQEGKPFKLLCLSLQMTGLRGRIKICFSSRARVPAPMNPEPLTRKATHVVFDDGGKHGAHRRSARPPGAVRRSGRSGLSSRPRE